MIEQSEKSDSFETLFFDLLNTRLTILWGTNITMRLMTAPQRRHGHADDEGKKHRAGQAN